MHIESFINSDISGIGKDCLIAEALDLMNDYRVSELPVIAENRLLNLVKEDSLLNIEDRQGTLAPVLKNVLPPVILSQAHPYEAAVRMSDYKLSLLPVIDDQDNYLGVVTRSDLFSWFFERTGLTNPGGIIVLEMKPTDYSLSEISRICESADATVLNVQLFFEPESEWMNVVIKTNKKDLQVLKASFERFEYQIKEIFGMLPAQDDLIDRYRLLMNYINM